MTSGHSWELSVSKSFTLLCSVCPVWRVAPALWAGFSPAYLHMWSRKRDKGEPTYTCFFSPSEVVAACCFLLPLCGLFFLLSPCQELVLHVAVALSFYKKIIENEANGSFVLMRQEERTERFLGFRTLRGQLRCTDSCRSTPVHWSWTLPLETLRTWNLRKSIPGKAELFYERKTFNLRKNILVRPTQNDVILCV